MTSFGLTACSAVYYQVPHCRFLIQQCEHSPVLFSVATIVRPRRIPLDLYVISLFM
jgi:hypothetical protein